jgi:hypothetical protein
MSKLHDYLMDLEEQQEELVSELADMDLGLVPSGEIGSDAAAAEADLLDAINDIQEKIAHLTGCA